MADVTDEEQRAAMKRSVPPFGAVYSRSGSLPALDVGRLLEGFDDSPVIRPATAIARTLSSASTAALSLAVHIVTGGFDDDVLDARASVLRSVAAVELDSRSGLVLQQTAEGASGAP